MTLPTITPKPLILPNVTIYVDLPTRLIIYEYRNVVNTEVTKAAYAWAGAGMSSWFEPDDFRASIYDFRQVSDFAIGNTPVAIRASQNINTITSLTTFPVALIVSNLRQEVKVRTTMMGPDGARKYIAKSPQTALEFVNEWNVQHDRQFNIPEALLHILPEFDPAKHNPS